MNPFLFEFWKGLTIGLLLFFLWLKVRAKTRKETEEKIERLERELDSLEKLRKKEEKSKCLPEESDLTEEIDDFSEERNEMEGIPSSVIQDEEDEEEFD